MKAQFKYAFRSGLSVRGPVFAVILAAELLVILLGSMGWLPLSVMIAAVTLGGIAIAVMLAVNIYSDVLIFNRIFSAPEAYLHALTPAPRREVLLASVVAAGVLDISTMAVVILGQVWLAILLASSNVWSIIMKAILWDSSAVVHGLLIMASLLATYLLILMIILFCLTMKKSVFYQKRGGWLLTALLAVGIVYLATLTSLFLIPFGTVYFFGKVFILVTVGDLGMAFYVLLKLLEAVALFVVTSKLMERSMNI